MGVGKILGLGGSKYQPRGGGGSGWVGRQAGTQKCLGGTPPGSVKRSLVRSIYNFFLTILPPPLGCGGPHFFFFFAP